MKTYFYEWTQNLAYYMVILTIVMQLLPSDNYKKYVQFFVKPLAFAGRHTLPILCWHLFVIEMIEKVLGMLGI